MMKVTLVITAAIVLASCGYNSRVGVIITDGMIEEHTGIQSDFNEQFVPLYSSTILGDEKDGSRD